MSETRNRNIYVTRTIHDALRLIGITQAKQGMSDCKGDVKMTDQVAEELLEIVIHEQYPGLLQVIEEARKAALDTTNNWMDQYLKKANEDKANKT